MGILSGFPFEKFRLEDEEPQRSFYPYHVSVLIALIERRRYGTAGCVIYSEEHRCDNGDYFIFQFNYDADKSRVL